MKTGEEQTKTYEYKPWIGVDLDGTLAVHDPKDWKGPLNVGAPIQPMIDQVRLWLAEGKDVRIFTARVCQWADGSKDILAVTEAIQIWCERHIGRRLPVTCIKDWQMVELYDDRAFHVIPNTGKIVRP